MKTITFSAFTLLALALGSCTSSKSFMLSERKIDSCPKWSHKKVMWTNNINNSDNEDFIEDIAFNLNIKPSEVTQEQFDERYN